MNCPSCGAPMRLTSGNAGLRCDYCGSIVVTAGDDLGIQFLDEAENLVCPACAAILWDGKLCGIPLRACKHCHGLLVPMGAFEPLIEQMRATHPESAIPDASEDGDLGNKVICPICHGTMDTHFYYGGGHAVISTCETCEIHWLDGGVMMKIVRAPHAAESY